MYFCPECNYTFDITKVGTLKENKKEITIEDAISKLKSKEELNDYKIVNNIENIKKNEKFKKLNENLRNKILDFVNKKSSNIIFNCLNCGYHSEINKTIRLYNLDLSVNKENILTQEDCKILSNDPILPRTKDYTCKNINCITHKKQDNKEAIFFKDKLTYKLKYVCCVCYSNWGLN